MPFPVWMLLGFAAWTLLLLLTTVGIYRWSHILTGRAPISSFKADQVEGADWYKRAMRAHANCVENLPIFTAIVVALYIGNVTGSLVNILSLIVLITRIAQSLVHVSLVQTNTVVAFRFGLFFAQILCFFGLTGIIVYSLSQSG